jgi:mono/diheme cytochrome c family protein
MLRKMRLTTVLLFGMVMAVLLITPVTGFGQATDKNERGRKLYVQYCASCHGMDAKGNGPVAATMKVMPTDLTTIAARNGKWNPVRVENTIAGDEFPVAHGTREMPVWGAYFRNTKDRNIAILNVYALTKYLEAIQR